MLKHIDGRHQEKLTEAMNTIECILSEHLPPEKSAVSIRDYYISDDIKLMIEKQRAFYAETHGWDDSFWITFTKHSTPRSKNLDRRERRKIRGMCRARQTPRQDRAAQMVSGRRRFSAPGVGTRLLEHLIDYCKENQYERIFYGR